MTRISAVAVQTLSESRMPKPSAVKAARANTYSSANNRFTPPQQQAAAAPTHCCHTQWSVSAATCKSLENHSCIIVTKVDYQKNTLPLEGPKDQDDVCASHHSHAQARKSPASPRRRAGPQCPRVPGAQSRNSKNQFVVRGTQIEKSKSLDKLPLYRTVALLDLDFGLAACVVRQASSGLVCSKKLGICGKYRNHDPSPAHLILLTFFSTST
jgi:hypothetical protein